MGVSREIDPKIPEEAAVWLQRLREEDTPQVRAEFSAWVGKGAENLQEFLFAQALWREMDHIDEGMRDRLWGKESEAASFYLAQLPLTRPSGTLSHKGRGGRKRWAVAAVLVVAIAAVWVATEIWPERYATRVGEQKAVKLADGSVMYLNTGSRAVVNLTETGRTIHLTVGEALFTVAHDAHRPFEVLTDSARIRALGTQFNVYRNSETETQVAVIEGTVQVSPLRGESTGLQLKAGDEVNVAHMQVAKAAAPNVERAVSWRTRRLTFPGNPVSEIVQEFNRYNAVPIHIEGETLRARRMSGVFDADDPSPLIRYLSADPAVEITRSDTEVLIREAR